ncbi:TRAP transporter small permease [Mariluticola halotolerans]|uniref:TRAP transporter small permease n=1 Tax=Mariluticola halotolerans TaxID=2909283 RepID=UPI0026E32754|nr:TRAP transporter small permease [Mariluticola halotolerans]UJQ95527.1 TRAP transporter small permease [Mariluticola halotolerans]
MKTFLDHVSRILNIVSTVALWVAGFGLVMMTIVVAYQVFGRYVLNKSPSWSEATAVMLMGWFIFLGSAVGVRERVHLGFDVLLYVVPPSGKIILRMISDLVAFGFGLGMVIYGSQLMIGTWAATLPTIGLPGGFSFMPLIASGILIALFTAERIARRLAGLRPDDEEPQEA